MKMNQINYGIIESPVGGIIVAWSEEGITSLAFQNAPHPVHPDPAWRPRNEVRDDIAVQLGEYFSGDRREFDLPLVMNGTAFQREVWGELRRIPYGETITYGELARRIGRTNAASRAVGGANGRNPLSIVVPCHRVIGSGGELTGYAFGLDIKRALLELERGNVGMIPEAQTSLFSA
ncbi:MAG: cysteine methyltransferase [Chlorobi bacterium]|nr:cysteine methyltransferase [Chlorobiota bacterium]